MLNHVVLQGRLTADPDMRRTSNDIPVVSFTLAVDRDFKGQDGQRETDFIPVVVWRRTAEFVSQYFTKGQAAVVSGRLQVRSYTDKQGNKRTVSEVVADNVYFAGKPSGGDSAAGAHFDDEEWGEEDIPF